MFCPMCFRLCLPGRLLCRGPCRQSMSQVPQVVLRKEAAPVVVPLAEEMTLHVAMVCLIDDGSYLPIALLDPEPVLPDWCIIDVSGEVSGSICEWCCCADVLADHF